MPIHIKPRANTDEIIPKLRSIPTPEYQVGFLEEQILRTLAAKGTLIREELCSALDRPRTTIFDNLITLIQHGYVRYFSKKTENQGKGRPFVFFQITSQGEAWIRENSKEE